ncbi:MAG TPA: YicC/YloC family endoribonuclease [Taishania sp.]|nr:YicC/YloC family endoribonuclease [Taishania sp.]
MSMTGFGRVTGAFEGKKVSIEVRSLNSKGLDLNTRIHNYYRELEPTVRKVITDTLERGKIDLTLNIDSTGDVKSYSINTDLAQAYYKDLKALNEKIGEQSVDYLALLMRMPDIFVNEKEELSEQEKQFILQLIGEACAKLSEFRRQEGIALEKEFTERIESIRALLLEIPKYEQERIDTVKERIKKGLEEIAQGDYDANRLEQELIYYIEKFDISEEKMRLANHLDYFLQTMKTPGAGKKLGFITQEIGREINTLGSKSNHAQMQKLVVDMKDNLEKIKEQVLNTL